MIITRNYKGNYNLRAKDVDGRELLQELVRALDMVSKDIAVDQRQRDEVFGHVIKLLQLSSQVPYLIPDSE